MEGQPVKRESPISRRAFPFELLHAESVEAGVVASVRRGGDTDTNAAIAGASPPVRSR